MGLNEVLSLLGGLALFLYGMQMMSNGLEDAAGNRMKKILERLTSNRFLGVAVGAGITAVIQSSSATTVMVVGFVNSGMMTLKQAVWIIMGANIGTTITGQLIALDVGMLAPLFAFIGVAMVVFLKKPKVQHIGKILAGLGVLFIGMGMMSDAMHGLRDNDAFVALMTRFSHPLLGILAGAVFTAIIQSSSASIGILQGLASAGVIGLPGAVYVLFGQNIGTCITAVLASVGTNRAAKRTTLIHLLFNVIGTTVFVLATLALPLTDWVAALTPGAVSAQIANMHTIFNVGTTLLLLPVGGLLARAAERLLPDKAEPATTLSPLTALGEEYRMKGLSLGAHAVHTDLLAGEIRRMVDLAGENMSAAFETVLTGDDRRLEEINGQEAVIDGLNKEISQYISKILVHNNSGKNVADIEQYFLITGNAERIGDHAQNIAEYIRVMQERGIVFSEGARHEIAEMQRITAEALAQALQPQEDAAGWMAHVVQAEQEIDNMTDTYRERHLQRMREGKCSEEACILYSELLTDFERIGDHILNIAQAYAKIGAVA